MPNNETYSVFNISSSEALRFRKIVIDVMTEACNISALDGEEYDGIGTLGEKQMHAAIKRFICSDKTKHEVLIDGSDGCISKETDDKKAKKRRFVADILNGNTIYEIQTGSFAPLREKIRWVLENTSYNLMLIHPIAEKKWISIIDSKTGKISPRKPSPQKGKLKDIIPELYYIEEFLSSPRFSLVILMMEAEQYKKNGEKSKRRQKYKKYELIPISLFRAHVFSSPDDYAVFIPEGLEEHFTVKQYSQRSGIYGLDAYSAVKLLCHLGLVRQVENIGRARGYEVVK